MPPAKGIPDSFWHILLKVILCGASKKKTNKQTKIKTMPERKQTKKNCVNNKKTLFHSACKKSFEFCLRAGSPGLCSRC